MQYIILMILHKVFTFIQATCMLHVPLPLPPAPSPPVLPIATIAGCAAAAAAVLLCLVVLTVGGYCMWRRRRKR